LSAHTFIVAVGKKGELINNRETEDQQLWKQLPQTEGEERAVLLIELAQQAIYRSSGNEALALSEEAYKIYKAMGAKASNVAMANAITGIGYSLRELDRVEEATEVLGNAIDLLRENHHPFVDDTMRTQASWYCDLKRWDDAINTYREIIQLNEIDGHSEFVARDLLSITHCLFEVGRWEETIKVALEAREIFKLEKMICEISWCDLNIAGSYVELGDGRMAIEWGQRANDLGTLRKDNEVICKSNYVMSRGHIILKEFKKAENFLIEAQDLVAKSGDNAQVEKIENALIEVYRATERISEAESAERRLQTLKDIVG